MYCLKIGIDYLITLPEPNINQNHNNMGHFAFGAYAPGYLLMHIRIPEVVTNIRDLEPVNKALFFHEYTHFLQNLTGGFGHSQIWNTYDRFRQFIAAQQKNGLPTITIPLDFEVRQQEVRFLKIMKAIQGGDEISEGLDDATTFVQDPKLVKNPEFDQQYPGFTQHFVRLLLRDAQGKEGEFDFGETAVSETMAYLLESKFYGDSLHSRIPYESAKMLAAHSYSPMAGNNEWLFALCDVALLSAYPGRMFYQILIEMSKLEFIPEMAADIYDFGIKVIYDMGFDIWSDFERAKNGAIHVIGEIYKHDHYAPTCEWFIYLLETGYDIRINNPTFMLQLYQEPDPFDGYWITVVGRMGKPPINNISEQRSFDPPAAFQKNKDKIDPIFLLAVRELHNSLMFGRREGCGLYKTCIDVHDDRCKAVPWERSGDAQQCPYASLWTLYGFNKKQVIFPGENPEVQ